MVVTYVDIIIVCLFSVGLGRWAWLGWWVWPVLWAGLRWWVGLRFPTPCSPPECPCVRQSTTASCSSEMHHIGLMQMQMFYLLRTQHQKPTVAAVDLNAQFEKHFN